MKRVLGVLMALVLTAGQAWALTGGTNISVVNGQVSITGTIGVANGGTGVASWTSNSGVLLSGTSGTGAVQVLAPTDDNVAIGNGTTFELKAIGDCTGAGKALTYVAASNSIGCNTISGGATPVLAIGAGMEISQNQSAVYLGLGGGVDLAEALVQVPMPGATLANLRCNNGAVQGVGNDVTIVGRVGACGSLSDGSQTCTITGTAGANQACSDTSNTLAPTAGQCVTWKVTTPATLTANARLNCSVERTA